MKSQFKQRLSVCLVNLGCHKNQVDAEVMCGVLDDAGYHLTAEPEKADIVIVNTCGFLQAAREESVEMLLLMNGYRKKGRLKTLVVAGCMADRDRKYLLKQVKDIDQFVSPFQIDDIAGLLVQSRVTQPHVFAENAGFPAGMRWIATPRSYGFVKISDGCDNRCSYCRIPFLKGSFRSKSPKDILIETQELIDSGRREIVIISQDTTSYGKDTSSCGDLVGLLKQMVRISGLRWLRLMYLYPAGITESLLKFMADNPLICRYLDIPLQHTDSGVLRAMNRKPFKLPGVKANGVYDTLQAIRRIVPGVAIRTTLMTGFPGETGVSFRRMLDLVDSGVFDHLGVFAWSREPDTPAADVFSGCVERSVAEDRAAMLLAAQAEVVESRSQERLDSECVMVVDGPDDVLPGYVLGRTEFQAPEVDGWVRVRGEYAAGTWLNVRLTGVDLYDYEGSVTGSPDVTGESNV